MKNLALAVTLLSLAAAANAQANTGSALAPGLYVQVLDGMIHVNNGGGAQNFSAGQFGYTAQFQQPPVILPSNPGIQFHPPAISVAKVTGTIRVVEPDGTVVVLNAGDSRSDLPAGSKIIVVSGSADISGAAATVSVDGVTVNAGAGSAFTVSETNGSVSVAVNSGSANVSAGGRSSVVQAGHDAQFAASSPNAVPARSLTTANANTQTSGNATQNASYSQSTP